MNKKGIQETIEYIEENGFLDKQSSTFIIAMTSYNYNLGMYFSYDLVNKIYFILLFWYKSVFNIIYLKAIELTPGGEAYPCIFRSPLRMNFNKKIGYLVAAGIFLLINIVLTVNIKNKIKNWYGIYLFIYLNYNRHSIICSKWNSSVPRTTSRSTLGKSHIQTTRRKVLSPPPPPQMGTVKMGTLPTRIKRIRRSRKYLVSLKNLAPSLEPLRVFSTYSISLIFWYLYIFLYSFSHFILFLLTILNLI